MKSKLAVIALLAVILLGGAFRVVPQLPAVFTPYGIVIGDPDASYQMRLVDSMVENFPRWMTTDAYALYPDGAPVGYRPVLPWLISGLSLIAGGGHPSEQLVDTIAVFVPPVLGMVAIALVFGLGTVIFRRKSVGLVAATFVAFMPNEFFHRTMLGDVDHHCIEIVLVLATMYCLSLAFTRRQVRWGILGGLALGLYLWNWFGGLFFAAILVGAYLAVLLWSYARHPDYDYWHDPAWRSVVVCFIVAAVVFIPVTPFVLGGKFYTFGAAAMALVPFAALLATRLRRRLFYFGLLLPCGVAAALLALWLIPGLAGYVRSSLLSVFWGFGSTIQEASPMTAEVLLLSYGLLLPVVGFGIILSIKHRVQPVFIIWSVVVIIAMFGVRRWDYYAATSIALFSAFVIVWLTERFIEARIRPVAALVSVLAVLLSVMPWTLTLFIPQRVMSTDWYLAMKWMRDYTPDPFDAGAYYQVGLSESPAYGVMSWWDYGHWIIREGRRVPVSSPTWQEVAASWKFFTAQSETDALKVIEGLNIRYIVIDSDMVYTKFYAMLVRAGLWGVQVTDNQSFQSYLENSLCFQLFTGDGSGYERFTLRFYTETVKVFEILPSSSFGP